MGAVTLDSYDSLSALLDLPAKLLNLFRGILVDINIPLPMFVAQALMALLCSLVAAYLVFLVRNGMKKGEFPIFATCGAGVMVVLPLWIVVSWIDYSRNPLSPQIVGAIMPGEVQDPKIDLLDFRERSLNPRVNIDSVSKEFVVNYEPSFADPPAFLVVSSPACRSQQVSLDRGQLRDLKVVQVSLTCGG